MNDNPVLIGENGGATGRHWDGKLDDVRIYDYPLSSEAIAQMYVPGQASNPDPADSETDVSSDADLSWTAGSGAASHDVYFGTSNPPPFQQNQAGTTYDPGPLDLITPYYWRIDEVNGAGTTTGIVWSFTTGTVSADFDGDGDVDQEDFGYFQACYSGPGILPETGCEDADLNGDDDVDLDDFAIFESCVGGANQPPGC